MLELLPAAVAGEDIVERHQWDERESPHASFTTPARSVLRVRSIQEHDGEWMEQADSQPALNTRSERTVDGRRRLELCGCGCGGVPLGTFTGTDPRRLLTACRSKRRRLGPCVDAALRARRPQSRSGFSRADRLPAAERVAGWIAECGHS